MLNNYISPIIRSKIGSKIVIFVFILIILVITSFIIFSYYQSQMTYLGNSINIAGKNRFLTSNLMFDISKYLVEDSTKDVSKINSAINQLESNVLALKQGGNIVGINLKSLPPEGPGSPPNTYPSIAVKLICGRYALPALLNVNSFAFSISLWCICCCAFWPVRERSISLK